MGSKLQGNAGHVGKGATARVGRSCAVTLGVDWGQTFEYQTEFRLYAKVILTVHSEGCLDEMCGTA